MHTELNKYTRKTKTLAPAYAMLYGKDNFYDFLITSLCTEPLGSKRFALKWNIPIELPLTNKPLWQKQKYFWLSFLPWRVSFPFRVISRYNIAWNFHFVFALCVWKLALRCFREILGMWSCHLVFRCLFMTKSHNVVMSGCISKGTGFES